VFGDQVAHSSNSLMTRCGAAPNDDTQAPYKEPGQQANCVTRRLSIFHAAVKTATRERVMNPSYPPDCVRKFQHGRMAYGHLTGAADAPAIARKLVNNSPRPAPVVLLINRACAAAARYGQRRIADEGAQTPLRSDIELHSWAARDRTHSPAPLH